MLNDSGRGDLSENDWNCKACGASVFASKKSCYRCGMPKDPDERRIDPSDGGAYTFSEFVDEYGGTDEWTAAAPMFSTEDVPAPLVPVNERLLKALLCAALYPQVVLVETPEPKKGGKSKGGGGGGGAIKFKIREGSDPKAEPVAVALHPSSVNARTTTFESKYLIYAEKVKTTQIYVRDCAPASPFAIMIFGGALKAERGGRAAAAGRRTTPSSSSTRGSASACRSASRRSCSACAPSSPPCCRRRLSGRRSSSRWRGRGFWTPSRRSSSSLSELRVFN